MLKLLNKISAFITFCQEKKSHSAPWQFATKLLLNAVTPWTRCNAKVIFLYLDQFFQILPIGI